MCRNIKPLHNFEPPATRDEAATRLLDGLVTSAPRRDREVEAAKARERVRKRFGTAAR